MLRAAGKGLHKNELARLRRDVRPVVVPRPLAVVQPPAPPVQVQPPPAPAPTVAKRKALGKTSIFRENFKRGIERLPPLELSAEELRVGRIWKGEGLALRRRVLNTLVEQHPGLHAITYKRALKKAFGVAMDCAYVGEVCRIAGELRKAERETPPPPTPPAEPPPVAISPRPARRPSRLRPLRQARGRISRTSCAPWPKCSGNSASSTTSPPRVLFGTGTLRRLL